MISRVSSARATFAPCGTSAFRRKDRCVRLCALAYETQRYNPRDKVREGCLRFAENRNYGVNGSPDENCSECVSEHQGKSARRIAKGLGLWIAPEKRWSISLVAENKMY